MRRNHFLVVILLITLSLLSIKGYSQYLPDSLLYQLHTTGQTKKALFDYSDGTLKSVRNFEYNDSTLKWVATTSTLYTTKGDTSEIITQKADPKTGLMIPDLREDFVSGVSTERHYEAKYSYNNSTKTWTGYDTRCERKFSDVGNLTDFRFSVFDSVSGVWRPYSGGKLHYSATQRSDSAIYWTYNESMQPISSSKLINLYTTDGKLISSVTYAFDQSDFTPVFRQDFNSTDTLKSETVSVYQPGSKSWRQIQKSEEITGTNPLWSWSVSDFDTTSGNWQIRYRHVLKNKKTTDSLRVELSHFPADKYSCTEIITQKEFSDGKTARSYMQADSLSTSVEEKQETIKQNKQVKNLVYWDSYNHAEIEIRLDSFSRPYEYHVYSINQNSGKKEATRSIIFYYKGPATNESDIDRPNKQSALFKYFPNPATDYIDIQALDKCQQFNYQIISLEGKIIVAGKADGCKTRLSLQTLQPGAYIIQISASGKTTSGIFIKKNQN